MYDFGDASITSLWSDLPACDSGDNAVERAGIRHGDLTDDQLVTAEIDAAFDDVLFGLGADDAFPETVGLAIGELTNDSRLPRSSRSGRGSTTSAPRSLTP